MFHKSKIGNTGFFDYLTANFLFSEKENLKSNMALIIRQIKSVTPRGVALFVSNLLIANEVSAPRIIFKLPIKAEALPAFFPKGSRERAVVLGF